MISLLYKSHCVEQSQVEWIQNTSRKNILHFFLSGRGYTDTSKQKKKFTSRKNGKN